MEVFSNVRLYSKKKLVERKEYGNGIYTFEGLDNFLIVNPLGVDMENSVFMCRIYGDVCEILPRPKKVIYSDYMVVDSYEELETNDAGFCYTENNHLIAIVDNCRGVSYYKKVERVRLTFAYYLVEQIFLGNELLYERYLNETKPRINILKEVLL